MDTETEEFTNIITQIVTYKGPDGVPYIKKYNKRWILSQIEERDEIELIEEQFKQYGDKGLDVVDFAKAFLNTIYHEENETLYLVAGLVDLYKDICETYDLKGSVKASDVLTYVVETFCNREWKTHTIPTKNIPIKKKFNVDGTRVREIDIEAPTVFGEHGGGIMRLIDYKLITDSTSHSNNIKRVYLGVEVKKVFTLDSLDHSIAVYNLNCAQERKIYPKLVNQKSEVMVLDFAWSEKQQRIGATLKDFSMSFWDAADNFEFEKSISTSSVVVEYQTSIWYIEFIDLWITSDKTHVLNVWDIQKESILFVLSSPRIKSNIIDVIPLEVLKLVAVSSMDKRITIWDFSKRMEVIDLDLSQGGIHSMVWSNSYQILLTAGYENNINLWSINPTYLDVSAIGRLAGHTSMITSVEVIDNTPMVISSDDTGKMKIWDIRNLQCVQTVKLRPKAFITKLVNVFPFNKICFVGSRVNFLEFDRPIDAPVRKEDDEIIPLSVAYNLGENEIAVCTRKDVRFIDLDTGRVKKIYRGLLPNDQDDITVFRLAQQDKKFILGDHRGNLGVYLYATGEKLKAYTSHQNEVTNIKIDFVNKLIVSTGWDSALFIQKETKRTHELKRSIKNLHYLKEPAILEISVYHNLIVTGSNTNLLYVWDYEYVKLLATIENDEGVEATYVTFINGFSYLIIGDSFGRIHFLHFTKKDQHMSFRKVASLVLTSEKTDKPIFVMSQPDEEIGGCFANKILIEQPTSESGQGEDVKMYISTNKGEVKVYDISKLLKLDFVKMIPHANTSVNFNSDRVFHEDFMVQIQNLKAIHFDLTGKVPVKSGTKSSEEILQPSVVSLKGCLLHEFKAHKDSLTTLAMMGSSDKKILTSSLDGYVKVWDLSGKLLGSLKISHPLPIVWNIESNTLERDKKRVLISLKLVEAIFKRYENKMLLPEQKNISVNRFLKSFIGKDDDEDSDDTDTHDEEQPDQEKSPSNKKKKKTLQESTEIKPQKKKKILLMKDEYSALDLQYDKAKFIYQRELKGPSLRQMEVAHRLIEAQKAWKGDRESKKNQDQMVKEIEERKERNDFMGFLIGDNKKNLLGEPELSKKTRHLAKQLDLLSPGPGPGVQRRKSKKYSLLPVRPRGSIILTSMEKGSNYTPTLPSKFSISQEVLSPLSSKFNANHISLLDKSDTPSLPKIPSKFLADTSKIVSQSKLGNKTDFIDYATEKLSSRSLSIDKIPHMKALPQDFKSEGYIRKLRRQNFHSIIHAMDQSLKKSQQNSGYLSNIQAQSPEPRMFSLDRNLQGSPIGSIAGISFDAKNNKDFSAELKYGSTELLSRKSPYVFSQELTTIREHLEDSWNFAVPGSERMKNQLSELLSDQTKERENMEDKLSEILPLNITKELSSVESNLMELSGNAEDIRKNLEKLDSLPQMGLRSPTNIKKGQVRIWNPTLKVKSRYPPVK